jgi:serine phosphatase RsbU (regulator of sigma subunit)
MLTGAGVIAIAIAIIALLSDSGLKWMIVYLGLFFGAAMILLGISFLLMELEPGRRKIVLRITAAPGILLLCSGIITEGMEATGSGAMLLVGSFLLSFISAPLLFRSRYDKWRHYARTKLDTFLLSFLDSIGLIVLVLGLLFKFMHWPAGNILIVSGVMLIIVNAFIWNMRFRKEVIFRKETEDKLVETLKEVELQKIIVEEKNHEILDSIRYARHIQDAILPPVKMVEEHLKECFVLYKPKDIVAGDFYWMELKNDKVYFAAADCTGHGVPGAMVSVMCSNALSKVVRETSLEEPGRILDMTVTVLEEQFSKSETEIRDGMDLALCCLDIPNGSLHYAGANNPLYLIRGGELTEIKGDSQPVGHFAGRKSFTTHVVQLQRGDCIYIFTDGYADQFGGPKGKKYKYKPFKELLLTHYEKPMAEQRVLLGEAIDQWRGELEQVDDICVMGLRV